MAKIGQCKPVKIHKPLDQKKKKKGLNKYQIIL